jgi:hypothetical protein
MRHIAAASLERRALSAAPRLTWGDCLFAAPHPSEPIPHRRDQTPFDGWSALCAKAHIDL